MNITPSHSQKDVIWCIGDRRKDIAAALALQKNVKGVVEPFSFGMDAAISILKNHISTDHILTSYADMEAKLKGLFNQ